MDRENDIFEQPSKVQNMNYLFEEEEAPAEAEASKPASRSSAPQRQRPAKAATASSPERAQARRAPQGQSSSRSEGARTPRQAQPRQARPEDGRTPRQAQPRQARPEDGRTPRQAQPRTARPEDGRTPRQAQPRTARPEDGRTPREAQPRKAQPRTARPEDGRTPRQAQPRQASASGNPSKPRFEYPDNRRVNRGGPIRGGARRPKRRSSGFKKFLLIYSAALLVILIVGMIIFSSFLKKLETSQPSNIAEDFAKNLTETEAASYLEKQSDLINCFGDPKDMINQFAANLAGKSQLSYIENKDYRADAPSYNITADGTTVAKITLEKAGSGSFGLSNWKVASIDIADYMDTQSFEFLTPQGATVSINGIELDSKYLTGEESIPENLQIASKYVTIPKYLTYKIAGIAGTPEISAKDANGNPMELTITDSTYLAGSATSQDFISSVDPLVNQCLEAWGRHFINMGGNLSAYMLDGSDWYSYIFGGPDMDPIMTSFYEFESIADYQFTEKSVGNYIKYTDDCFTVDVKYKMKIDFTTDQMSDENQQLDATWVFITQNGGQDWYLIDCIYK